MAAITPSSDLYLIKSPLELNDNNQLNFADKQAQANYFLSLPKFAVDDFTYIRKDGVIRYPAGIDTLLQFNYVMYKNENYSNKWFFAYITGMEYINDNMTAISIRTDCFQTWQFDLKYKACFVERETVLDDGIGKNTVPEGLDTGEPTYQGGEQAYRYGRYASGSSVASYQIGFMVSDVISGAGFEWFVNALGSAGDYYNNVYSGCWMFAVGSREAARAVINAYDGQNKGDAIVSLFAIPWDLFDANGQVAHNGTLNGTAVTLFTFNGSRDAHECATLTVPKSDVINNWKPRNNKMWTYPYYYLEATNNNGVTSIYKYEDFNHVTQGTGCKFKVYGALCQGCSFKMFPYDYKSLGNDVLGLADYSLNGGKLPTFAWASDFYLNWQAQNSKAIEIQAGAAGLSAIGSFLGGNLGGVVSGLTSIVNNMAEVDKMSKTPDQARGNVNAGDINHSMNLGGFTVRPMGCRYEYAERIDRFFSMYGYKINMVKVPAVGGRLNWNYIKTVDCYIEGDIPQLDLDEIKQQFDNGITIWHNPKTFMDYEQMNPISL